MPNLPLGVDCHSQELRVKPILDVLNDIQNLHFSGSMKAALTRGAIIFAKICSTPTVSYTQCIITLGCKYWTYFVSTKLLTMFKKISYDLKK